MPTLADCYRLDHPDLFAKCEAFARMLEGIRSHGGYESLFRVTLVSGLDHRIRVLDPATGRERELICFDSNSYLGLHLHPRVVGAVHRALDDVGYGTPSAQLLCGTNRYLCALEETVARFHGREAAMVFPSGYAANVGALVGLLREGDTVFADRFSHASLHDGARAATPVTRFVFPHRDVAALERMLARADGDGHGKLIVTDGVFSMHGTLAPLPELVDVARRHGARLLLDEAHATGVLGPTGHGSEERFGLPGAVDVLIGTFSKAAGAVGGYVCGGRALVDYLRFYARPGMFTASLPAATCAGLAEAYRVMEEEPEHREALWRNTRALASALCEAGLPAPAEPESPILTLLVGSSELLLALGRDLFAAGLKCGSVDYPAVPKGEAILRLAVNARHTARDLAETTAILRDAFRRYGMQHRTPEEIRDVGARRAA
jgi:8-amino-7-oxononanoate synthase